MLYVILDNGDFVTMLNGEVGEPVLEYLKEPKAFDLGRVENFLVEHKGFRNVPYNLVELVEPTMEKGTTDISADLTVILDDGELSIVVEGGRASEIHQLEKDFWESGVGGSPHEYLQLHGFCFSEVEICDRIDVLGPVHYAQSGIRISHRIFLS